MWDGFCRWPDSPLAVSFIRIVTTIVFGKNRVFARHRSVNLEVALCLLLVTRGNPGNQKGKRYEIERSYSTAFSSLTKREFHAHHPEEAARDGAASLQFEKNFREGGQDRKREAAASLTPAPRETRAASRSDLPVNQRLHATTSMTFMVIAALLSLEIAAWLAPVVERYDSSALQFCAASISGTVLAITFFMHRLVSIMIDRADLHGGIECASALNMVRCARPSVAVRIFQGGRWTKDRCGGDQQWCLRLSGRGWTDRRRSG